MMTNILVQLSESDKRILFAFLLVFILVFVIIGYLGMLVVKTMKWQGKRMDALVNDVLTTFVITDRKHFFPYARKKNNRLFFKQSWIPILIIIVGVLALVFGNIFVHDWNYNPFNAKDGFGSLLFIWNWKDPDSYTNVFGFTVLAKWPPLMEEIGKPQFVSTAISSYIFVPCVFVGGIWYLISVQAYIARTIRMHNIAKKSIDGNLDNFNQKQVLAGTPMPPKASESSSDIIQ